MLCQKMKTLTIATLLFTAVLCNAGGKHIAKHSQFTVDQLVEHLELIGGNWNAEFEKECYVAYVFSSTDEEGKVKKSYQWSTNPSKKHKLLFMHDIKGELHGGRLVIHRMKMDMTQVGEWKKWGKIVRSRSTFGGGITRNEIVSNAGSCRYATRDLLFELDKPVQIFSWSDSDSKRSFSVSVLFATSKEEKAAAPKP